MLNGYLLYYGLNEGLLCFDRRGLKKPVEVAERFAYDLKRDGFGLVFVKLAFRFGLSVCEHVVVDLS
ncbi:hypothetical protein [Paenibacillus sp. HW567]|uniref:hypothetical protein n=1 Tax=Paenibacillus sp. HW567 TaxID=1034769 RepID=UPI0003A01D80|nr:hypothetical protein [Paenibacillus sp. HW567]